MEKVFCVNCKFRPKLTQRVGLGSSEWKCNGTNFTYDCVSGEKIFDKKVSCVDKNKDGTCAGFIVLKGKSL